MRILYSAIDQRVPSYDGGSVHVTSVAEGLAQLGHDVHVLASPGSDAPPLGAATWSPIAPPFGSRRLRLLRAGAVLAAARAFKPDVIMERYYNFGGEGVLAARRIDAMAVLEINAPVSDYPGSTKRIIDKCLVIEPMRRWREWQCQSSHLIVTPSIRIVPPQVPAAKIFTTEWGADTVRFRPDASGDVPFQRNPGDTIVVFAGAFRAWHGAVHLVHAIRRLHARGRSTFKAVLVGDGPELPRVRRAAEGIDGIVVLGAVPHSEVPAILAAADIGAAPFDVQAHPSLAHEFHWSPLKIFEYMSSGLPVVAPRIERIAKLVCDGTDGILYDGADPDGLADALERLADPTLRRRLGTSARAHAVREFSWEAHCRGLQDAIQAARDRMTCAS
jgi:glycosyltransferase involved in cell wall biosynthesis